VHKFLTTAVCLFPGILWSCE